LTDVEPNQRLLHAKVIQLYTRVLVECLVVLRHTVGGLEGPARLLGVSLLKQAVGKIEKLLRLAGFLLTDLRLIADIAVQIQRHRPRGGAFTLELEGSGPMTQSPLVVQLDLPGDVFERKVKLRGCQLEFQVAAPALR